MITAVFCGWWWTPKPEAREQPPQRSAFRRVWVRVRVASRTVRQRWWTRRKHTSAHGTPVLMCGDVHPHPGPSTKKERHPQLDKLRVLVWNTRGIRSKVEQINIVLDAEAPDIVLLQETHLSSQQSNEYVNALFPKYRVAARRDRSVHRTPNGVRRGHGGGVMTLEAKALETEVREVDARPYFAVEDEVTEAVVIDIAETKIFNVYRPPLGGKKDPRRDLFTLEHIPTSGVIVAGDLNAHHGMWDPLCRVNDKHGVHIHKWIVETHARLLNDSGRPTYFDASNVGRSTPDLVIASPDVQASEVQFAQCLGWDASDHTPMKFDVHMPNLSRRRIGDILPKYAWKRADWGRYTKGLETKLPGLTRRYSDPDELMHRLTARIIAAADRNIPKTTPRRNRKAWWRDELTVLVRKRERARRLYTAHPTETQRGQWAKACEKAEHGIHKAKERYTLRLAQTTTSLSAFKGIAELAQDDFRVPSYVVHQGRKVHDVKEMTNVFANVYETAMAGDDVVRRSAVDAMLSCGTSEDEPCGTPFSLTELDEALYDIEKGKAAGPDMVANDMLKHLGVRARAELLAALNRCWESGHYPTQWRRATIVPLAKPGKDVHLPSSYRPISLTSNMGKLFERMLLRRLRFISGDPSHAAKALHVAQAGGQPLRGTEECIAALVDDIAEARANGEWSVTLFFDLKAAFDRVPKHLLVQKLAERKCPRPFLKIIDSFLSNRTARARIFTTYSEEVRLARGVPQGAVLSPYLFLHFVDDLIDSMWELGHSGALMFADDLAVPVRGKTRAEVQKRAQAVVERVEQWCHENSMLLSHQKTTFMLAPPEGTADSENEISLFFERTSITVGSYFRRAQYVKRLHDDEPVFNACEENARVLVGRRIVSVNGRPVHSRRDVFLSTPQQRSRLEWVLAVPVMRDDTPRYLGVDIEPGLTGRNQCHKAIKRFHMRMKSLKAFAGACGHQIRLHTLLTVYEATVLPMVTYGFGVWGPMLRRTSVQALQKAHVDALSWIYGRLQDSGVYIRNNTRVLLEARMPTMDQLIDLAAVSLWDRCKQAPSSLGHRTVAEHGRTSVWQARVRGALARHGTGAIFDTARSGAVYEKRPCVAPLAPWGQTPVVTFGHTIPGITRKSSPAEVATVFPGVATALEVGADWVAYTDGSADAGYSGSGLVVMSSTADVTFSDAHKVGVSTILDAEMDAIVRVLYLALRKTTPVKRLVIYSDSESSLRTLARGPMRQKALRGHLSWYALSKLDARGTEVVLQWVPGHKGIRGNALADDRAEAGRLQAGLRVVPGTIKKLLRGALRAELLAAPECALYRKVTSVRGTQLLVHPHPNLTYKADVLLAALRCGEWPVGDSLSCPGCAKPADLAHLLRCPRLKERGGAACFPTIDLRVLVTREQEQLVRYLVACGVLTPLQAYILPAKDPLETPVEC